MNKHLILVAMLFLILGFQNCSNMTSFDADGALVAKSDVSVQDDAPNTHDGIIDEIADQMPVTPPPSGGGVAPQPAPAPVPGRSPTPAPPQYTDREHHRDHDHDEDHDDDCDRDNNYAGRDDDDDHDHDEDHDDNDHDEDRDDNDHDDDHKKASFVCVLGGSGSSTRLGQSSAGLSSDTSAVNDVCMSEKACLETVSKAFQVKGAEKRGYCKEKSGNPNVVRMSDKDVEDAIAKEMLKRIMTSN